MVQNLQYGVDNHFPGVSTVAPRDWVWMGNGNWFSNGRLRHRSDVVHAFELSVSLTTLMHFWLDAAVAWLVPLLCTVSVKLNTGLLLPSYHTVKLIVLALIKST